MRRNAQVHLPNSIKNSIFKRICSNNIKRQCSNTLDNSNYVSLWSVNLCIHVIGAGGNPHIPARCEPEGREAVHRGVPAHEKQGGQHRLPLALWDPNLHVHKLGLILLIKPIFYQVFTPKYFDWEEHFVDLLIADLQSPDTSLSKSMYTNFSMIAWSCNKRTTKVRQFHLYRTRISSNVLKHRQM